MTLKRISELIDAKIYNNLDGPYISPEYAYASDMMSDVLAFAIPECILITGLRSPQVVRTAEMKDISCIIFTRSKIPGEDIISLAESFNLCVMCTSLSSFETSGILYSHGIKGIR